MCNTDQCSTSSKTIGAMNQNELVVLQSVAFTNDFLTVNGIAFSLKMIARQEHMSAIKRMKRFSRRFIVLRPDKFCSWMLRHSWSGGGW